MGILDISKYPVPDWRLLRARNILLAHWLARFPVMHSQIVRNLIRAQNSGKLPRKRTMNSWKVKLYGELNKLSCLDFVFLSNVIYSSGYHNDRKWQLTKKSQYIFFIEFCIQKYALNQSFTSKFLSVLISFHYQRTSFGRHAIQTSFWYRDELLVFWSSSSIHRRMERVKTFEFSEKDQDRILVVQIVEVQIV